MSIIKLTELDEFIGYFRQLAEEHKEIQSFYPLDVWEIVNHLRNEAVPPVLFLEYNEGVIFDNRSDNDLDIMTCALWVAKPVDLISEQGFDNIRAALAQCKEIVRDIIARILNDFKQVKIVDFYPERVRYHKVGPIWENNYYGYRVEFDIADNSRLKFNPEKWQLQLPDNPEQ